MSDELSSDEPAVADHDVPGPESADDGDRHGHDVHAEGEALLGPIDWPAWGAGALGVVLGLAIAACFAFATQPLPNPY